MHVLQRKDKEWGRRRGELLPVCPSPQLHNDFNALDLQLNSVSCKRRRSKCCLATQKERRTERSRKKKKKRGRKEEERETNERNCRICHSPIETPSPQIIKGKEKKRELGKDLH